MKPAISNQPIAELLLTKQPPIFLKRSNPQQDIGSASSTTSWDSIGAVSGIALKAIKPMNINTKIEALGLLIINKNMIINNNILSIHI